MSNAEPPFDQEKASPEQNNKPPAKDVKLELQQSSTDNSTEESDRKSIFSFLSDWLIVLPFLFIIAIIVKKCT
jgi:hypothetical protein